MRPSLVGTVFAACLCATSVGATNYVVDDSGGAGVDFTDINAAIGACVPGDVLEVRAGTYDGFALDIPITIVGAAGATINGGVQIYATAAGKRTTLSGLQTAWITIDSCAGPVTIEELVARQNGSLPGELQALGALVTITNCADVRIRGLDAQFQNSAATWHALRVVSSRVELTHSRLFGSHGKGNVDYYLPQQPTPGGDGLRASGTSTLLVSSSYVVGGEGGSFTTTFGTTYEAGAGGAGMRLLAGATALVTGPDWCYFIGGQFGWHEDPYHDGPPGSGIVVQSGAAMRISTAGAEAGLNEPFNGIPTPPAIVGAYEQAAPADPVLTIGDVVSVQPTHFTIAGQPGDLAFLHLGRKLVVVPLDGVLVPLLTEPLRTYNLGFLPGSGQATFTFNIPAGYPKGAFFIAQGRTIDGEGNEALTQSMPLTVR